MLFPCDSPYPPLYSDAILVPCCPLPMRPIISPGVPFLYSVSQSIALLIVPNASDGPISSTLSFLSSCSMYCSTLIIAPMVEIPSLYPY